MQALVSKRLYEALSRATTTTTTSSSPQFLSRTLTTLGPSHSHPLTSDFTLSRRVLGSPWSAIQHRGAKTLGSDIRIGDVIQRKGRVLQVLKAQHTMHGRGGAIMQVELRDIDSGNKVAERFHTDEPVETVAVEDKDYTYLYTEGNTVVLMEPETYDQIEVSKDLFGKAASYLKEDLTVTLKLYDGKAMSASVPNRVTCTVVEAKGSTKDITGGTVVEPGSSIRYKKVLLDNGLTVQVPPFVATGDEIVIKTADDSYFSRAR